MGFAPIDWIGLVVFCLVAYLPAFLNGGGNSKTALYDNIDKPLNIPRLVFPIVWTTLYTLYWLAGFLAWQTFSRSDDVAYKLGLACYFAAHFFNALWTYLFFGRGWIAVAALDIIIMLALYTLACVQFFLLRQVAGWLLIPIIMWSVFALFLTMLYWSKHGASVRVGKAPRR